MIFVPGNVATMRRQLNLKFLYLEELIDWEDATLLQIAISHCGGSIISNVLVEVTSGHTLRV